MQRLSRVWRRAAVMDPTKLFGSGRPRSKEQKAIYNSLKDSTVEASFPHLAACWVGPCWGSVMQNPSNLSPTCSKMAVWRCSVCMKEFEKTIATFIDDRGVCPLCGESQPQIDTDKSGAPATYNKAPRMIHANYKSVIDTNPEWENLNIQPMLAQRWELVADELRENGETGGEMLLASPKIDGIRCIIGYNKARNEVQCFSRGGIVLECCHGIVPQLLHLFKEDPALMLDGELFAPECNFEQLNGLVRRRLKHCTPDILTKQAKLLEYFAFDVMYSQALSSPNAHFDERYRLLKRLIPVCGAKRISNYQHDEAKKKVIRSQVQEAAKVRNFNGEKPSIYHVPAAQVHPGEMDDVLSEACSQGFEGVMIRRPNFPYQHGRRSFGLLKYKQMHDAEFKIVGYLPGEGKFKGGLGAFVCETRDGLQFSAPPRVSLARRLAMWNERESFLGMFLTVQYQELSRQDVPRFPVAKSVRGGMDRREWL